MVRQSLWCSRRLLGLYLEEGCPLLHRHRLTPVTKDLQHNQVGGRDKIVPKKEYIIIVEIIEKNSISTL